MIAARRLWELDPEELDDLLRSLTAEEADYLLHSWEEWARPEQLWDPRGPHRAAMFSLYCCGRGWGKSRTGAEAARWVGEHPLEYFGHRDVSKWRGVLVGRTAADVRGTMLYGPSGLMTICPEKSRPLHVESKRLLIWPSGVQMLTFSADEPEQLRGPTFAFAWGDEFCAWPTSADPEKPDAYSNLVMGLREPAAGGPKAILTTTPRPTRHIRKLAARARAGDRKVHVVFGRTMDNADNLAPEFLGELREQYEGTRLGRQELEAEILDDNPHSLWPDAGLFLRVEIAETREGETYEEAARRELDLVAVVVAVDPSVAGTPGSCETGIVVAGRSSKGRLFVLEDASLDPAKFKGRSFEEAWARAAVEAARRWRADAIVGETNNGGALVEANIKAYVLSERADGDAPAIRYGAVWASKGKAVRAEPVATLYERCRVVHVGPPRAFLALERACQAFDPTRQADQQPEPIDRMDALVWAVTFLLDAKVVRSWSTLAAPEAWELDDETLAVFR